MYLGNYLHVYQRWQVRKLARIQESSGLFDLLRFSALMGIFAPLSSVDNPPPPPPPPGSARHERAPQPDRSIARQLCKTPGVRFASRPVTPWPSSGAGQLGCTTWVQKRSASEPPPPLSPAPRNTWTSLHGLAFAFLAGLPDLHSLLLASFHTYSLLLLPHVGCLVQTPASFAHARL